MLIHHIFLQPQICFLLISGLWRYFTYIVDTAGFSSLRIFVVRTCVLLAHIRTVVLFYLHRRHGWLTPASVYSWSALACFLLISGLWCYSTYIVDTAGLHQPPYIRNPHLGAPCSYPDIRQIKKQRQASLPLFFYFPHCLRLHHAHSGAGTGWHCWSVLFDCSYC